MRRVSQRDSTRLSAIILGDFAYLGPSILLALGLGTFFGLLGWRRVSVLGTSRFSIAARGDPRILRSTLFTWLVDINERVCLQPCSHAADTEE